MVGFVICVALSFYYGWKLTLVVIGYVPILIISNMIVARVGRTDQAFHKIYPSQRMNRFSIYFQFQAILTEKESNAYAAASAVSEEVLGE